MIRAKGGLKCNETCRPVDVSTIRRTCPGVISGHCEVFALQEDIGVGISIQVRPFDEEDISPKIRTDRQIADREVRFSDTNLNTGTDIYPNPKYL